MSTEPTTSTEALSLELLRQQLEDLRAEHQCCLDWDEAWADKWRRQYEKAAAQRDELLTALRALVAAYDGSFTPLAAISAAIPNARAAIAKFKGR